MSLVLAALLSPLLLGIITRVKAWFAGRRGAPLLQPYHDLLRLVQKGAVYSHTTTWVFKLAPSVCLACSLGAAALLPSRALPTLLLACSLLALQRFWMVLAALDTGSSFEGMGASREVHFSALAELGLLFSLAVSLSQQQPSLLVGLALFIVVLAESARVPVDDPNTHLELTMVHEVMILDHSGPDLAYMTWAAAIKLWVLGALAASLLSPGLSLLELMGVQIGLALAIGVVESSVARLRLLRISELLATASALAALALLLQTRGS